MISWWTFRT